MTALVVVGAIALWLALAVKVGGREHRSRKLQAERDRALAKDVRTFRSRLVSALGVPIELIGSVGQGARPHMEVFNSLFDKHMAELRKELGL